MRNLILLFTLLVSGFMSAQTFDFSCEDTIEFVDSFLEDNNIACASLSGDVVVRFGDRYYLIDSEYTSSVVSTTTEQEIIDEEYAYDESTTLADFIIAVEDYTGCAPFDSGVSIEVSDENSGKSASSAKGTLILTDTGDLSVDVVSGQSVSFSATDLTHYPGGKTKGLIAATSEFTYYVYRASDPAGIIQNVTDTTSNIPLLTPVKLDISAWTTGEYHIEIVTKFNDDRRYAIGGESHRITIDYSEPTAITYDCSGVYTTTINGDVITTYLFSDYYSDLQDVEDYYVNVFIAALNDATLEVEGHGISQNNSTGFDIRTKLNSECQFQIPLPAAAIPAGPIDYLSVDGYTLTLEVSEGTVMDGRTGIFITPILTRDDGSLVDGNGDPYENLFSSNDLVELYFSNWKFFWTVNLDSEDGVVTNFPYTTSRGIISAPFTNSTPLTIVPNSADLSFANGIYALSVTNKSHSEGELNSGSITINN